MKKEKFLKRPNSGTNIQNKDKSKDLIIKNLENKISLQEEKISQLMEYKTLYENKLKELGSSIEIPLKSETTENNQFNVSNISLDKQNKNNRHNNIKLNLKNYDLSLNKGTSPQNDKYDNLYNKYMNLLNDYKNLSDNTISTAEYTKVKTQYDEIKNQNSILLKKINNKEEENEKIKELNQQVETFREQLILSQALINSLKTELEEKNTIKGNKNVYKKEDAENIKKTLKNNNILLSNILKENNELRKKVFVNNDKDFIHNNNEEIIRNLKNNLNEYENKFDYFNEYINIIKNKIKLIFNDLKSIINKYENNYNFMKGIKPEINNLIDIDRFNLDPKDDEKCLEIYIYLVKCLLNYLTNMNEYKIINKVDNSFNKTMKQLMELFETIKKNIKGDGLLRLISDALNIIINLSNLYKSNNKNYQNKNNNINEKIIKLENEFQYIKQIINNYRKENIGKKLTYTLSYNSKGFNTINRNKYYFKYS